METEAGESLKRILETPVQLGWINPRGIGKVKMKTKTKDQGFHRRPHEGQMIETRWPSTCPECRAQVVWGGTPDADYDCDHYSNWVGQRAPWWIALPGLLRRLIRRMIA